MKYRYQKIISLIPLTIGLIIDIYAIIFNQPYYWDIGILIVLIGIIINDYATQTLLKKYIIKYGETE